VSTGRQTLVGAATELAPAANIVRLLVAGTAGEHCNRLNCHAHVCTVAAAGEPIFDATARKVVVETRAGVVFNTIEKVDRDAYSMSTM